MDLLKVYILFELLKNIIENYVDECDLPKAIQVEITLDPPFSVFFSVCIGDPRKFEGFIGQRINAQKKNT